MKELILVCAGSFFGGGARYLLSKTVESLWTSGFPWATLTVNVIGCFLIGLLSALFVDGQLSSTAKWGLMSGFCGGFTTFSTFMNDNWSLGHDGQLLSAFLYTSASFAIGLFALFLGYYLVKQ